MYLSKSDSFHRRHSIERSHYSLMEKILGISYCKLYNQVQSLFFKKSSFFYKRKQNFNICSTYGTSQFFSFINILIEFLRLFQ